LITLFLPQPDTDPGAAETVVVEALIEYARTQVTGCIEDADELINVDTAMRSLLTGAMAWSTKGS